LLFSLHAITKTHVADRQGEESDRNHNPDQILHISDLASAWQLVSDAESMFFPARDDSPLGTSAVECLFSRSGVP
jgi:hypothetical protein